jgi:hypothetical protein
MRIVGVRFYRRRVTVHGQARGTDPFSRATGSAESHRVHEGVCIRRENASVPDP